MSNSVDHPDYYNTDSPLFTTRGKNPRYITSSGAPLYPLECIDVIRDMPTWKGNAIKYLWRAGLKQEQGKSNKEKEIEDLNKAIWYIQDRINQIQ